MIRWGKGVELSFCLYISMVIMMALVLGYIKDPVSVMILSLFMAPFWWRAVMLITDLSVPERDFRAGVLSGVLTACAFYLFGDAFAGLIGFDVAIFTEN